MLLRSLVALVLASLASLAAGLAARPSAMGPRAQEGEAPDRALRVLFLGDDGHHMPAQRAQEARVGLAARGIHVHYTDDLGVLTPAGLEPFDVVLLYANVDVLPPEAEAALLGFVRGGKGFAPIHCASYCFRNSDAFVALVGAQFQRHGTGTFTTRHERPEHPVLAGLEPFESWDETYVHTRHASDRTVLATRVDDEGAEPWTWVRDEGAGRVFYTAWGHDRRTWTNPGFLDLLARGLRWAAGDEWLAADPTPPELPSVEAPVPIPNYVANWQLGDDITRMQAPLTPEESLEQLVVEPGLRVELFASEPLIRKPITLAWDERGRAWIAETTDYPNELTTGRPGADRISILTDADGDGRADASTTFADGLSIPTSLCFANGGVVVAALPDTLFLRDTDGDDVADERTVLFTGWGTGDTHAGPSNLRPGPDGWIWGTVGYSGFDGVVGGVRHRFGSGLFRFRPDGSALEFLASTSNNTWGLGFSEEGHAFASTANGRPSQHLGIPNRAYESVRGLSGGVLDGIEDTSTFHPVTDRVRQVDWHGRYTAGAGHALYTARAFPREYWNRIAFVCGPTGHLVGRYALEPAGSQFVARDRWTLVASRDEWTAPILAEVGPDGAVWVIDWYNYIVQHNPVPQGFELGRGNAYVTPLRDKVHGRIWRVVPEDFEPSPMPRLAGSSPADLVAALGHDVLGWRQHAQRLLVERGDLDVLPALVATLRAAEPDALGLPVAALHSLWTLVGLDALEVPEVADALRDVLVAEAAPLVRATAEVLPRTEPWRDALLVSDVLGHRAPKVRLAGLLALAEMPPSPSTAERLVALAHDPALEDDAWLADAVTIAAAANDTAFLAHLFETSDADAAQVAEEPPPELLTNPGLEAGDGEAPTGWRPNTFGGRASFAWTDGGRNGGRAVRIDSEDGADAGWSTTVRVDPTRRHRLSAWIRTRELDAGSGRGAQLNVHELQGAETVRTEALTGTRDWTRVAVEFDPRGLESLTINLLFGGWGRSRGTAWFDDVRLEALAGPALPGALGAIVQRVTRHLAERAPEEHVDVTPAVASLAGAPDALAVAFLEGLSEGWRGAPAPDLDAPAAERVRSAAVALDGPPLEALAGLVAGWGRADLLGDARAPLRAGLVARATDAAVDADARAEAAARLLALDDGGETASELLAALDLDTDPAAAEAVVRVLAASTAPDTGDALVARLPALGPSAQRAAVGVLVRRGPWTRTLLEAVRARDLPAGLVDSGTWLTLEAHPDAELADLARDARGGEARPERAEVLARFADVAELAGDAGRGEQLFATNCLSCHAVGEAGGAIGPALDGIGQNPAPEVLTSILDPNASVEANYQLWIARGFDGSLYSGRLVAESRTSIEILEPSGISHVLQREDLEEVLPSPLSLMPEGFESLGRQGLADVLAYLRGGH